MNLADCYRLLELSAGATPEEIKASYRRLARRYHPDVNPENSEQAKAKFIQLTEAYQFLLEVATQRSKRDLAQPKPPPVDPPKPKVTKVRRQQPPPAIPKLSELEQKLKSESYQDLQRFLKLGRYARAIALVEGLAQRLPKDPEVRQWQAIAYQQWGRQLTRDRQVDKARVYLKKALRTDPHNRSLWMEVERDFRRLERMM